MGISITGNLLPFEVTREQWEQVYEEVLTLVNAYDFLDMIVDSERFKEHRKNWYYGIKTQERESDGKRGIFIYGALKGCVSAEDQFLSRDLEYYLNMNRSNQENELCHDALKSVLYGFDGVEKYKDYERRVFGNKTQGRDHHNYLLAIALLLEDRLGKAFTVSGDITRGQIKYAIAWANRYLSRPISMPCRTDNLRLLGRLNAFVPHDSLLKAFMQLTFSSEDEELNEFMHDHFSKEEIFAFWAEEVSDCWPGTLGSSQFYQKYFSMSADLKLLAEVCSTKFTAEQFVKDLAGTSVFEEKKNTINPAAMLRATSERETPETVETSFGKILALMGGLRNSAVKRYIPLKQGIENLKEGFKAFGNTDIDLEAFLKAGIEEQRPRAENVSEALGAFEDTADALAEKAETCDIFEPEDLVFYEAGHKLHEDLKQNLDSILKFVDSHKEKITLEFFQNYSEKEAENKKYIRLLVLWHYCKRLLPKTVWDVFEQHIDDDEFFFTLLTLLSLKADTIPLSYYVKGLLCNSVLFDEVLLSKLCERSGTQGAGE